MKAQMNSTRGKKERREKKKIKFLSVIEIYTVCINPTHNATGLRGSDSSDLRWLSLQNSAS